MEREELYDSLEEDYSTASSTSLASEGLSNEHKLFLKCHCSSRTSLECTQKNHKPVVDINKPFEWKLDIQKEPTYDISSIIPLYGGDKMKYDVEAFNKCCSACLQHENSFCNSCLSKSDSGVGGKTKNGKKRSKFTFQEASRRPCEIEEIIQNRPSRSYLNIFHARIGYPEGSKRIVEDTVRPLYGDSQRSLLSADSERTIFKDASDRNSDSLSCFQNQIENYRTADASTPRGSEKFQVFASDRRSLKSFNSASESCMTSMHDTMLRKSKSQLKRPNIPDPVLGSLGPDFEAIQDKLERRKKQWNYGQKASNRNRIRIMELNALKKLKSEIEKSKCNS